MDISDDPEAVRALLNSSKVVAVVGASDNPERESYQSAAYIKSAGYIMIPVNPGKRHILGEPCYPSLRQVPMKIDIVDVFRNPADVGPIVEDAVAVGAHAIWFQVGVVNEAAAKRASDAGLLVAMDR